MCTNVVRPTAILEGDELAESQVEPLSPADLADYVYDVVEAHALPTIDCSKSIKAALLSKQGLRRLNRFLHRFKGVFALSYAVGLVLGLALLFLHAQYGRPLAVAVLMMQCPSVVTALISLRYDMVALLIRTYEFWFFSCINVLTSILLGIYLNDLRWVSLLVACLGYQNVIVIDANFRAVRFSLSASIFASLLHCGWVIYILLGMVDGGQHFQLIQTAQRVVAGEDVLTNGLATLSLLLFRNGYRKQTSVKRLGKNSSLVQCISYRCTVFLRRRRRVSEPLPLFHTRAPHTISTTTQMRYVPLTISFNACQTVWPFKSLSPDQFPHWFLRLLNSCGITGALLVIAAFPVSQLQEPRLATLVSVGAFVSSLAFCGTHLALYQRGLLYHLCSSFDFLFLSTQLTLAHLCVCDMFYWSATCFAIVACWMWIHWVLTLDALTPVMRAKLAFHVRHALLVAVLFVVALVWLCVELVFCGNWHLQDQAVFNVPFKDRRIKLLVVPFFFSRLLPIMSWSCRVIWRIWNRQNGELVVIQGNVAYEEYHVAYKPDQPTKRNIRRSLQLLRHRVHPRNSRYRRNHNVAVRSAEADSNI